MSNRSHRNAGHRTMNRLKKEGRAHASVTQASVTRAAEPVGDPCHQYVIGDCTRALADVPGGSARMIVCDPPYNLKLAHWDEHPSYLAWAEQWLGECKRVLADHGSLAIFGGIQFQNERGGDLLDLIQFCRRSLGLVLVNVIVWNYPNGMSAHRFFASRHEEIAWFVKGPKYVFNLDAVREPYDAATLKAYSRDKRLRPETLAMGRNPTNVWRMPRLNANAVERTGHPTQKPRAIVHRLITALSNPGDLVIDPFAGSGVTARVAAELGRSSLSIDIDPELPMHLNRQFNDWPVMQGPIPIEVSVARTAA